ncbi:MAG: aminoglycoside phosphotransferase [Conexibacter sp.]|jgi:aminoglycoside phosphotransferase (APT) family kinase protein|nr:aminoglycoside phosphotransferase [Conexibacter sp.]
MTGTAHATPEERDVVVSWAEASAQSRAPLVVLDPLREFLDRSGIGSGELVARPIGDGHSNVTFELLRDDVHVVLRRPPRPPFAPSAHDVLREARLLLGLAPAGVRVPRVLATCDDEAVVGAPFYVMEHVDGAILGAVGDAPPEDVRPDVGAELVDALIQLHAVDVRAPALQGFGRPTGYLERQLRRFASVWETQRTRPLEDVDRVGAWLTDHLPGASATAVVHGDYRLGNVMLSRSGPCRLLAILDWEMATVGDPLADVGYLCATWAQPGDAENPMLALSAVTRLAGFATPDDLRERYATATGRDVDDLRFYEVLALWKSAIFLESSFRRFREGTTDDPYFAALEAGVPRLARAALERTGRVSSRPGLAPTLPPEPFAAS